MMCGTFDICRNFSVLILASDIILAGNNAKFGQPEVKIGTIPGLGGSQRLVRAIGKSRAMEMVLTGATIPVQELQHSGLIARIVPEDQLVDEALSLAQQIASLSRPVSKATSCSTIEQANSIVQSR